MNVAGGAPGPDNLDQAKRNELLEVPVKGLGGYSIPCLASPAGKFLATGYAADHVFLPVVELSFEGWRHGACGIFRDSEAIVVTVGAGEGDDEVAVLLTESGGVEAMGEGR